VYLDIHMPGLNGMETAKRLREIGFPGDIVFFTVSRILRSRAMT
jgi:CheY-like chemotaxis protein